MRRALVLALLVTATLVQAKSSLPGTKARIDPPGPTTFRTGADAMAVLSVAVADACADSAPSPVSAAAVWVDGRYDHELLLFPGSGRERYDTLLGPFAAGPHRVELKASALWHPSACTRTGPAEVTVVAAGSARHVQLRHSPVVELRADTVGEQTDLPLYAYVEDAAAEGGRRLRYTVVFSNEDGGTPTRALFARWGRTTDIEQVYEVSLQSGRAVREEFQGPDHETRAFAGRRRGVAPILLVTTLNNMVTDRGRGIAAVRLVPEAVDLTGATRESTLDRRPWAYRVMARELAAEGHVAADAPEGDRWLRQAPDPRQHVYLEARLALDGAVAAAWARDRDGVRSWSHYQRAGLAIDRNGWVRTAVPVASGPASAVAELGWACLPAPGRHEPGTCVIETLRAFAFSDGWLPGPNLITTGTLELHAGEEGTLGGRR
jgi:hypothetical protein